MGTITKGGEGSEIGKGAAAVAEATEKKISSTFFQRRIGEVVNEVLANGDTILVCSHGRPQVVLVHPDEYERLMQARRDLIWRQLNDMGIPEVTDQ